MKLYPPTIGLQRKVERSNHPVHRPTLIGDVAWRRYEQADRPNSRMSGLPGHIKSERIREAESAALAGRATLPSNAGFRRRVVGAPSAPMAARPWPWRAVARERRRSRAWQRS